MSGRNKVLPLEVDLVTRLPATSCDCVSPDPTALWLEVMPKSRLRTTLVNSDVGVKRFLQNESDPVIVFPPRVITCVSLSFCHLLSLLANKVGKCLRKSCAILPFHGTPRRATTSSGALALPSCRLRLFDYPIAVDQSPLVVAEHQIT